MKRFEASFYRVVEIISALLLCFMVIIVFSNIICRYFLSISIASTEELSRFAFIWISFIGATLCLKTDEHLSIDVITKLLPKKMKSSVYLFDQVVVLIIVGVIAIGGLKMTISDMGTRSAATNLQLGYVDMIVPIVAVIMIIIQLQKIYVFIAKSHKTLINVNSEKEA